MALLAISEESILFSLFQRSSENPDEACYNLSLGVNMNYVGTTCILYPKAERIVTILTEISLEISRLEIWLEGFGEASVENRTHAVHGGTHRKSKQWRDRERIGLGHIGSLGPT